MTCMSCMHDVVFSLHIQLMRRLCRQRVFNACMHAWGDYRCTWTARVWWGQWGGCLRSGRGGCCQQCMIDSCMAVRRPELSRRPPWTRRSHAWRTASPKVCMHCSLVSRRVFLLVLPTNVSQHCFACNFDILVKKKKEKRIAWEC